MAAAPGAGAARRLPMLNAVGRQRCALPGPTAEEQDFDELLESLQTVGTRGTELRDLGLRLALSHAALRERHGALRDEFDALLACLSEAKVVSEAQLQEHARARASARLFGRLVGDASIAQRILLGAGDVARDRFLQAAPLCVAGVIGVAQRLMMQARLRRREPADEWLQDLLSNVSSMTPSTSGSTQTGQSNTEFSGAESSEESSWEDFGSEAASSRSSATAAQATSPCRGRGRWRRSSPSPPPEDSARATAGTDSSGRSVSPWGGELGSSDGEPLQPELPPSPSSERGGADGEPLQPERPPSPSSERGGADWAPLQPEQPPPPSKLLRPRAAAPEARERVSDLSPGCVRRLCALAGARGTAGLEACSRAALASVRAQRGVYLCGGCSESAALQSLYCFDPQEKAWVRLPDMHYPRDGAASVTLSGRLYVLGGNDRERFAQSAECYDPWKGAWSTLPEMSRSRFLPCAAVLNGEIYICGGEVRRGLPLASVERFSPSRGGWQSVAMMAEPRRAAMAAVLDGQLCVCGGSGPASGGRVLSTVECYEPGRSTWRGAPPMSEGRSFAGAVTLGGRLYMFAGLCSGNGSLDTAECLEAAGRPWRTLPSLSAPRYGPAVAAVDARRIVVCGGCSANPRSVSDRAEIFDCASEAWLGGVPSLLQPRCFSVIAVTPARVYVCGGVGAAEELLDSAEQLDLDTGEWTLMPPMPAKVSCAVGGGLLAP